MINDDGYGQEAHYNCQIIHSEIRKWQYFGNKQHLFFVYKEKRK